MDEAQFRSLLALARDYAVATPDGSSHLRIEAISKLLRRIREAFRMDVVFVSEFVAGMRVFRHVDAAEEARGIVQVGQCDPVEQSYCQRVVDGRLPQAIRNAVELEEARALPATQAIPIGAHLSVPIVLPSGDAFGTLCCFSRRPSDDLAAGDAQALSAIADLIAAGVDRSGKLRAQLLLRDVPGAENA